MNGDILAAARAASGTAGIYRDATFTEMVRNQLDEGADIIENVAKDVSPEAATGLWPLVEAIRSVVERWDANDATETVFP